MVASSTIINCAIEMSTSAQPRCSPFVGVPSARSVVVFVMSNFLVRNADAVRLAEPGPESRSNVSTPVSNDAARAR